MWIHIDIFFDKMRAFYRKCKLKTGVPWGYVFNAYMYFEQIIDIQLKRIFYTNVHLHLSVHFTSEVLHSFFPILYLYFIYLAYYMRKNSIIVYFKRIYSYKIWKEIYLKFRFSPRNIIIYIGTYKLKYWELFMHKCFFLYIFHLFIFSYILFEYTSVASENQEGRMKYKSIGKRLESFLAVLFLLQKICLDIIYYKKKKKRK